MTQALPATAAGAGAAAPDSAKLEYDEFSEMSEMNTFSAEEDTALASQLDGEALVQQIGTALGNEITSQVKGKAFSQQQWYKHRKAGTTE